MPEQRMCNLSARFERREDGGNLGTISGMGAVFYRSGDPGTEFELWEGVRERIAPGTFARALSERQDVRGLFNHSPSRVLGRTASGTMRLAETRQGLSYEIDLADTPENRGLASSIERGDITGSSFSFQPVSEDWEKDGDGEVRTIKDVDLYDVGPVTFPAYKATSTGIRSEEGLAEARKARDAWIRGRGPTRDQIEADLAIAQARM